MKRYSYTQADGTPSAPVSENDLKVLHQQKKILDDSWVMEEGGSEWVSYSSLGFSVDMVSSSPILTGPSEKKLDRVDLSAEKTRKENLSHEASLRSIGMLYYIGGVLDLLLGIGCLISLFLNGSGLNISTLLVCILFLTLGGFLLWLAPLFRSLDRKAVVPGTILSSIGLIGFPIGTLLHGYILYLIRSKKGKTVFSEDYKRVIAATPHIYYKTSIIVKIAVWLLIVFIVLGVTSLVLGALLKHKW